MIDNFPLSTMGLEPSNLTPPLLLAQLGAFGQFFNKIGAELGGFLPSLVGAIFILIGGWLVATIAATAIKQILLRTDWDNRLYTYFTGQSQESRPPTEKWAALLVFWTVMIFALVGFFSALNLTAVSDPLNQFLAVIFDYLPKLLSAVGLALVAFLLATGCKLLLVRVLAPMQLDDKLAEASQGEEGVSPFPLNETLGTALYWLVWLLFLPAILGVLQLEGLLLPIQNLLDTILAALPNIITAGVVLGVGWLVATVVRNILVNFLKSVGADSIGAKVGLPETEEGTKLSDLLGLLAFVLILVPIVVAALEELAIEAISAPAIAMLNQFMTVLPQVFTAAAVLVVFFVIGRFLSEIVSGLLTGFGFDNVLSWLGLSAAVPSALPAGESTEESESESSLPVRTPSELVGTVVLVLIMLFAAVVASEVLALGNVTEIARSILRGFARILSGVFIFGIGLYLANLASNLLSSAGTAQSRIMGQAAKVAIIILVSAMALQQIGVAESIVIRAFTLLLGAIAVAVAIAFGWGGRDIAAEKIRNWWNEYDNQN